MLGNEITFRPRGKGPRENARFGRVPLILSVLLIWAFAACNGGTQPDPVSRSTKADGAKMLDERCSTCHGLNKIIQVRKTRSQWEQTITRMVTKGARLTEAEKTILLNYLNMNFAP